MALFVLFAAAAAPQPPAQLVSGLPFAVGDAANGSSELADVSPDGRFVLLTTAANNLHAADVDLNGTTDVYLLDRSTGAWQLISHRVGMLHRSASSTPQSGGSVGAAVSDDGRYVLFDSPAPDLVATPQSARQIYLYDRALGASTLVSHLPGQPEVGADGSLSAALELSADGRYALFSSSETELIAGATGSADQALCLFDRQTGANRLVSHGFSSPVTYANGSSSLVQLSADGRLVLFNSFATNLAAGITDTNPNNEVFLWDRETGAVELLSRHPSQPAALGGFGAGLSADGRYVLLSSYAALQAGMTDNNGTGLDCFLHDRQTGASQLVSRQAANASAGGSRSSFCTALSADGRWAYFNSQSADLVAGFFDANGVQGSDIFLFERTGGGVTLVSHAAGSTTTGGNGSSLSNWRRAGAAAPDGSYLLYTSDASNLDIGAADSNGSPDLYLYDQAGSVSVRATRHGDPEFLGDLPDYDSRVDVGTGGEAIFATERRISEDGGDSGLWPDVFAFDPLELRASTISATTVAGLSASGDGAIFPNDFFLDPGGRFAFWRAWGYDRVLGSRQRIGHRAGDPATPANGEVWVRNMDAVGRFVLLSSWATDLVAGATDSNGESDVFLYDRSDKTAFLVSHAAGSPAAAASGPSFPHWLSADGRRVLLRSFASNLVPGGPPGSNGQLFFFDRPADQHTLISHRHDSPVQPVNAATYFYGISSDERFVLISSAATDLVSGFKDTNGLLSGDLYWYDRVAGQATLITHRAGAASLGSSREVASPMASGDFRYVYFTSPANDLTTGAELPTGAIGFYRWDRLTGNNQLLMMQPNCHPSQPRSLHDVSLDGRLLLITTTCSQVPGDQNGVADVYVFDRISQQYQLISHQPGNPSVALGDAWAVQMSDDGRRITYTDLALDDFHAFSYDRTTGQTTDLRQPAFFDPAMLLLTSRPLASADGNVLLMSIGDPAAAPYDANTQRDLFLVEFDRFFADGFESGGTSAWSLTVP